ncbi:VIT1/CCC1 transporter family protein [Neoactinobaculum massilliense]|uniref:VIT1/CCC1 transporter family protein n=1 Tax=Neoactinobaculum massilliense TaxID=2364794 RepID=UPI000F521C9A|nr:VIT1/CCC1 transporter family protein [Neoactinobaculum massilliense]
MAESYEVLDETADTAEVDEGKVSASEKMNRLRAGVLGANDGIVSVAAVVIGMVGGSASPRATAMAGLAALVGGAVSMALGEFVSVSSQRDAEMEAIRRNELDASPRDLVSPVGAAISSFFSFLTGGIIPMLAVTLPPIGWRLVISFGATIFALAATGFISAHIGDSKAGRATIRMVVGGTLGLALTFLVGMLFGQVVA